MGAGRATTLEGDNNNSSGAGSLTNNGAHLPESEDYHSALTWLDEERDELNLLQTRRKRSGFALPPSLSLATALLLATPLAVRGQSLRQLYHRSWTVREGVPSSVTSIAQTTDCSLARNGQWDGSI